MQPFLEKMLELQIFRQFCEERLAMLNDRRGISDEFEMEVVRFQVNRDNGQVTLLAMPGTVDLAGLAKGQYFRSQ